MDCDTTGVEPDIALVKYKKLVGGGMLKIVNRTVPMALAKLGYTEAQREAILAYIDEADTIEGAPGLREEHLPVFDCAFRPVNGQRSIAWMGHIRMMGAVQPFLSGAISKTVNLPAEATVDDVKQAYVEGWRLGLKALAVYRDGSKRTQPLNTGKDKEEGKGAKVVNLAERRAVRMKLPDERQSITHKFSIAGHEGYLTVGLYENGQPGEIFLKMAKEGSTISGLMDTIATMTSIALQYGVPPKALVDKFSHMRFEPSGFTNNPQIPMAKSIMDYVFRWLGNRFVEEEALPDEQESSETGTVVAIAGGSGAALDRTALEKRAFVNHADAPACSECGTITVRNGACYKCPNCGATSGCS
jgi:ribonucleoside-diphosphate reductase alpha chain